MSDKVTSEIKKEIDWYKELLSNAIDENNPISARLYVKQNKKLDKEYLQENQLPVSSTQSARRATIVAHKLSLLNKGER